MEKNWIVARSVFEMILFNPLPPINDQEKISPYSSDTISSTQVMRIK